MKKSGLGDLEGNSRSLVVGAREGSLRFRVGPDLLFSLAQAVAVPSPRVPAPDSSWRGWKLAPWRPELRPTWRRWYAGRAPPCACAPRRVRDGAWAFGGVVGVEPGSEGAGPGLLVTPLGVTNECE